jgi:cell wall-associated NlpC family hydrolase
MIKKFLLGSLFVVYSLLGFANDDAPIKKKVSTGQLSATEVSIKDPYLRLADDIQRYSKKFMGIHYVWGGKITQGFDCSGLVSYVFAQFGMKIELPSAALFKLGYDMPPAAALPGDLIFFRRSTDKRSDISHVGIVLESNECGVKFIHSSRGKGVAISYLHEKYYATHFGGVRRVMDSLKEYKY